MHLIVMNTAFEFSAHVPRSMEVIMFVLCGFLIYRFVVSMGIFFRPIHSHLNSLMSNGFYWIHLVVGVE